jgi:hypothetical protein
MDEDFVYHMVADPFQGSVLYPLNQLKEIYPDVYAEQVKKYEGREHILEIKIPAPLNCLWNDVLHFTAVHPMVIFQHLESAGFDTARLGWNRWYKVPITLFNPENTSVCVYNQAPDLSIESDFIPFDPANMANYRVVPPATIGYYKRRHALGTWPLLFHCVPHILFKGTVDISDVEIIEV